MEHRTNSCSECGFCKDAQPRQRCTLLFPGVRVWYLPQQTENGECLFGQKDEYGMRLIYCRRGDAAVYAAAGGSVRIHAGELAVWKQWKMQENDLTHSEDFSGLMVCVDLKTLTSQPPEILRGTEISAECFYDRYCTQSAPVCMETEGAFSQAFDLFYEKPASTAQAWQTLGAQALLLLLWQYGAQKMPPEACDKEQARIVREIHRELTQNLERRVTIEELARAHLMNPTTLKQVFKSIYGTSLAAHMKEHRMGKAAQLLRETDLSVLQIARAVGYESQSKFTAAFKTYFGMLPKEYRKGH